MCVLQSRPFLIAAVGADAPAMTASVFTTVPVASGFPAERERLPGVPIRA
jgi:hypothetical protein